MRNKLSLPLILFIGLILRLINLNQSLWLDEAIGALVVRERNFLDIMTKFPLGDNHPPLYYGLLDIWSNLLGYSEVALRSLSVLTGILTIGVVYLIAQLLTRKPGNHQIGFFPLAAALLLATSPFHVYYSQEARMYILTGLLASSAVYSFLLTLKYSRILSWVCYATIILLLVFTDYLPVFLLPIFWIYAWLKIRDYKWWKYFILSHIPLLIAGLLWFPIFISQSKSGAWLLSVLPAWRDIAGGATFKQAALVWFKFILGRISLYNKIIYYGLISLASLPVLFSLGKSIKNKNMLLIWLWLLFPLTISFIVSFIFPAFNYFRFVFIIPAFYLLLASGMVQMTNAGIKILITLVLLVNTIGLSIYYNDEKQQRENWREAVQSIESKLKDEEVVLFENTEPFAPYRYYGRKLNQAYGATDSIAASENLTRWRVKNLTEKTQGVYLFEYLRDLQDPQGYIVGQLLDEGYTKVKIYSYSGVGQVVYWTKDKI